MKIIRAVKCAAVKEQLDEAMAAAKSIGIAGLEVHSLTKLVQTKDARERGNIIIKSCLDNGIRHLAYHSCPFPNIASIPDSEPFDFASSKSDFIIDLTKRVIEEAAYVGSRLSIPEIPIIVHIVGLAEANKVSMTSREYALSQGEKSLKLLKAFADECSAAAACRIIIARENNTPSYEDKIDVLLEQDPRETLGTQSAGIASCLDLSHFQQYLLYKKGGNGRFRGADLSWKVNPIGSEDEILKCVAPNLAVVHLSDSDGYLIAGEGLEIGKGSIDFASWIPIICDGIRKDIIGTYEIKDCHQDNELVIRSDNFLRKTFGRDFSKYFI